MDTECQQVVPVYSLCYSGSHRVKQIPQTECVAKSLFDLDRYASLKDFNLELKRYCKEKTKRSKSKKKKQKLAGDSEASQASYYVPEEAIRCALQKCLVSESFWCRDVFDSFVEGCYVTPGLDDVVYDCIVKYRTFASLKILSKYVSVVPEKYTVKLLKSAIETITSSEMERLRTKLFRGDCPIAVTTAVNISYIMLLPVNKVSLAEYLKLLTLDEALVLIQFLHYVLHIRSPALLQYAPAVLEDNPALLEEDNSSKGECFDEALTEGRIVTWLDLVVSAKLMGFITSPVLSHLVVGLQRTMQKQRGFYKDVAELGSCLKQLQNMHGKKQPEAIHMYQIETITL